MNKRQGQLCSILGCSPLAAYIRLVPERRIGKITSEVTQFYNHRESNHMLPTSDNIIIYFPLHSNKERRKGKPHEHSQTCNFTQYLLQAKEMPTKLIFVGFAGWTTVGHTLYIWLKTTDDRFLFRPVN